MKTEKNVVAAPVQYFPLDRLYLSDMNPRQDADAERIDLLADSIIACGLIQNLAGLADADGRIAIVAGGRRLRALIRAFEKQPDLLDRRPELAEIPVRIAPDETTARAWANVENAVREALNPADEIRAFAKMRDAGADVPTIAKTFATSEAAIYRRLALSDLPAPVLDALKAGKITLNIAKAFTVANDPDLALEVLAEVEGNPHASEHRVKARLQPEAVKLTDRRAAFVGLDAYTAAGGEVTRDLFEENGTYLQNPDLLDRLFAEKLEDAATAIEAEGWKWIEVIPESYVSYNIIEKLTRLYKVEVELTEEQAERYDELAELYQADALDEEGGAELEALQELAEGDYTDEQRQHAGAYVYVDSSGTVDAARGYIRPEDRAAAVEAEVLTGFAASSGHAGKADDAPKSPYNAALVEDMRRARLHAIQAALLAKPELVLDLLAFGLSGRGGAHENVFDIRPDRANITPEKANGLTPEPRLSDESGDHRWLDDEERLVAFTEFQAEGKKARNAALTEGLARTLPYPHRPSALFDHIEASTGADLRHVWTPTAEGFFKRVNADYLDSLMLDLTGCNPTGNGFKSWKAMKKSAKADALEKLFTDPDYQKAWHIDVEKKARIDAWRPGCI